MNIYRGRNTKEFYLASALYDSIEDLNSSAVVSLIKDKGADANIVLPGKGISPFHLAIGSDDGKFALFVAGLVLQHGGDPNVRSDEGLTPLHIAAAWGRRDLVELLLSNGADPDLKDWSYQTAVDYAVEEEHHEIAKTIKDYINNDVQSFFAQKNAEEKCFIMLDKILINNGAAIGEYEELDSPIDLKVLPETNPDEYVKNWCNTLQTQLTNLNLDQSDELSLNNSSPESFNAMSASNFRNVTMKRPQPTFIEPQILFKPHPNTDFCKLSENSRESGILTFSDSTYADDECLIKNNADEECSFIKNNADEESCLVKNKDASSDYFTCTDVSENVLEQNIYEVSSNASTNRSDLNNALLLSDSDLSFVSVSEVYKYSDPNEGIVFYEKRFLPPQKSGSPGSDLGSGSSSKSSKLSSLPRSFNYDTDTLRDELTSVGFEPGPITKTTKRVYLRKLYNLKRNPQETHSNDNHNKKVFSNELQKTLRNPKWSSDLEPFRILEQIVSKQFANPDPNRKWREGVNKSSFTYLLLDPRITENLPLRAETLPEHEVWEIFLSSVFYVGKGKRSRPYQHLYEAITLYTQGVSTGSGKLQRIMDIWRGSRGVICLHLFLNVIPVEAYTREAAMISALKLENLQNVKAGDFYGVAATWGPQDKRSLGVYLLYKAMRIFLNEGERQLSPGDID